MPALSPTTPRRAGRRSTKTSSPDAGPGNREDIDKGMWPALLSLKLLCSYLSLGKSTIWLKVSAKEIPAPIYIGRRALWKRDAIDNWLDEQL